MAHAGQMANMGGCQRRRYGRCLLGSVRSHLWQVKVRDEGELRRQAEAGRIAAPAAWALRRDVDRRAYHDGARASREHDQITGVDAPSRVRPDGRALRAVLERVEQRVGLAAGQIE